MRGELARLCGSFGIGVIELDIENPEKSLILFPAATKENIDWDGANKLAKQNPDFRKFLTDVRIDITNSHPHQSEYDLVMTLEQLGVLSGKWNV